MRQIFREAGKGDTLSLPLCGFYVVALNLNGGGGGGGGETVLSDSH